MPTFWQNFEKLCGRETRLDNNLERVFEKIKLIFLLFSFVLPQDTSSTKTFIISTKISCTRASTLAKYLIRNISYSAVSGLRAEYKKGVPSRSKLTFLKTVYMC